MADPKLRPLGEWATQFAHYSAIFRRLRPAYPEAIVFEVDAGDDPEAPNCRMRADTRTSEGDIDLVIAKSVLREQPEFSARI